MSHPEGLKVVYLSPPLATGADFIDYPWFGNLGALHGVAALRAAGVDVRLVDAFACERADVFRTRDGGLFWGQRVSDFVEAIGDAPVDVAVISATPFLDPLRSDGTLAAVLRQLRSRRPGLRTVLADGYLGAMHYPRYDPQRALAALPELDYVCLYETEGPLVALLRDMASGSAAAPSAPASARILLQTDEPDLDTMPPPAWDLVNPTAYGRFLDRAFRRTGRPNPFRISAATRPIVTSRGCVYGCVFCTTNPQAGPDGRRRYRAMGPQRVAEELARLRDLQGARHLAVLDQVANLRPHFSAFLEVLAAEGFDFDFPNGLRADRLDDGDLERMKGRIGTLSISAESGVQRVVDEVVGKRLDLRHIERVAARCAALAIPLVVHFMVGLPGERRAEMEATLDFARDLYERHGAEPLVSYATPFPGTRLAALVDQLGLEDDTATTSATDQVQHVPTFTHPEIGREELQEMLRRFRESLGPKD